MRNQRRLGSPRGAARELPAGTNEVARLAIGMFLEIILVVLLSLPEWSGCDHLTNNSSGPQAGRIDIGDGVEGGTSLFFTGIEDGRTDVSPFFLALAVQRGRIVDLEEELQEIPVRKRCRCHR